MKLKDTKIVFSFIVVSVSELIDLIEKVNQENSVEQYNLYVII